MLSTKLPKAGLLLAVATLYSLAHLTWYLDTPLGINPVLDGQENLILAQQIEDGTLAREPFFRAMLYPALLAFLPIGHSLLGLLCHLANAALSATLARRFWRDERAGLWAGGLVGLNPVLLHFAFDPLDTTLAIALFLSALAAAQKGISLHRNDPRATILFGLAGAAISLATLARPHFLLTLVVLGGLIFLAAIRKHLSKTHLTSYTAACAIPLLAIGFIQQSWSGSFQILPWQGAYNLWISNNSQANGLYYQQSISFHHLEEHQNPNRMEAAILFEKAHGKSGTIAERNAYWRGRTLQHVADEPIAWLRLEAFKLYAAFNNFEQYNNKTYLFHKRLAPWLRYNPISWGVLLALAIFCSATLWHQKRKELAPVFLLASSLLAGLLIYMASARFRLPLTPLLAILAGGLPLAWPVFRQSSPRLRRTSLIVTGIAVAVAFSRFAGVASERTFPQDALLLADAAARSGDDELAVKWSSYVLEIDPDQQQGLRLRLVSRYNQIASGSRPNTKDQWDRLLADSENLHLQDELLSYIRGVVRWNVQQKQAAKSEWQSGYDNFGAQASSCLAALHLTGTPLPKSVLPSPIESFIVQGNHWILAYAIAARSDSTTRRSFLANVGLPPETFNLIGESLARVLPLN